MHKKKIGYIRFYGQEDSSLDLLDLTHRFADQCPLKDGVRPELGKAYQLLDSNTEFYVASFISLASNLHELKRMIEKILSHGATVTFIKEMITLTDASKIELQLISSMADFEKEVKSSLRKDGIFSAINSGKTVGRKKMLSAEEEQKVVERIKNRESIQKLSDEYQVSRTTLYKCVQDLDWWKELQEKRKRPKSATQSAGKSKKANSNQ